MTRTGTELDRLVADARADVERRKRLVPRPGLRAAAVSPAPRGLARALSGPGLCLIAEFKRRSPSVGEIGPGAAVADVVRAYERGGAGALSVLTDEPNFGGSLDDLREARAASELPLLRKDFIVDPYQLDEAVASGADAVLLIVAALDEDSLSELHRSAIALGLDCLVEVHDERDLDRALAIGAQVIGINNRDLRELTVDVATTERLLERIPSGTLAVAESGYARREQLAALERSGAAGVLVGEALMRAGDPEAAVRGLLPGAA